MFQKNLFNCEMLQSFFVPHRKFGLNESRHRRLRSVVVLFGPVWQSVRRLLMKPSIFLTGGGHSEKATLSEVKHLEPRPKICLPDHPSAWADSKANHKFHTLVRSERVEIPQQTRFSQRLLYVEVKNQHFLSPPGPAVTRVHALWMCYDEESLYLCWGWGRGGVTRNWLVSAKCGRGLTSMFQSASWVGRCWMIHQMLG